MYGELEVLKSPFFSKLLRYLAIIECRILYCYCI